MYSEADRAAWMGRLGEAITAGDEARFFDAVRAFHDTCSKNARVLARQAEKAAGTGP